MSLPKPKDKDQQIFEKYEEKIQKGEEFRSKAMLVPKSTKDKIKKEICKKIIIYKQKTEKKNTDLAKELKVTDAQMTAILRYRWEKFTVDFLADRLDLLAEKDDRAKAAILALGSF